MQKPNPDDLGRSLNNSGLLRFVLLFACGWIVVQLITYFYNTITLFTASAILAVLMEYPVRYLSRYLPRGVAITLVVLGIIGIAIAFTTVLGYQILTQGNSLLASLTATLQTSNLPFKEYLKQINLEQITTVLQSSLSTGLGLINGLFSNLFSAIFLLVISIYMVIDGSKIWAACLKYLPNKPFNQSDESIRERFNRCVQKNFLGFLRAQVTLIIFLATASFLVFSILGVKFSLVLAIVVGVLDAIPGVGATLGVIIITILVFLSQGPWIALRVIVASVILQQIQDNYIHPRVMGKALAIDPILIFLALFIGEKIAGLLGVFLAIPITGMIVSWFKEDEQEAEYDGKTNLMNGE